MVPCVEGGARVRGEAKDDAEGTGFVARQTEPGATGAGMIGKRLRYRELVA